MGGARFGCGAGLGDRGEGGGRLWSPASQMLVLEVLFTAMIARSEGLIERIRASLEGVVVMSL